MDEVLRSFVDRVEHLGPHPELKVIAGMVAELAADSDYWQHHIDADHGGFLVLPDEGTVIALAHRTDGMMSAVHSHGCWAALCAVEGVETHRRYQRTGPGAVALAEELHLHGGSGTVATLSPPDDIHSHGHVRGSGDWPWTLIVLGDNQLRFTRQEFDLGAGTARVLEPGDFGNLNLPEPE